MNNSQDNQKQELRAVDVENIEWTDSKYYPTAGLKEHTLNCTIRGEPNVLTYELYRQDDGESFVIRSEG